MHPAPSIIAFTTLSGIGFGLIIWLGLGAAPDATHLHALILCLLAAGLVCAGLLASLLHLGQPTRFLKAFSQWRTSWLSREAALAMTTLVVFALYAALWVTGTRFLPLGLFAALVAFKTVFATAMIYAQMRSVPRWRSVLTPVLFLLFALTGGALFAGVRGPTPWLLGALGLLQIVAWLWGDRALARSGTTLATATGLGEMGRPRLLEPPHTGQNYLLKEMVFVVGRRHAAKLRVIGLVLAVVIPVALIVPTEGRLAVWIAADVHALGALVLRWLFFAQAEHVVGLYYGKR